MLEFYELGIETGNRCRMLVERDFDAELFLGKVLEDFILKEDSICQTLAPKCECFRDNNTTEVQESLNELKHLPTFNYSEVQSRKWNAL